MKKNQAFLEDESLEGHARLKTPTPTRERNIQIDEHPTVHEIQGAEPEDIGAMPEILPPDLVSDSFANNEEDNKEAEKPPQLKGILISIENSLNRNRSGEVISPSEKESRD